MTRTGFYDQKGFRPGGFALVVALHGAAFAALVLVKTTVDRMERERTQLIDILPTPPPERDPPPEPRRERAQQPSTIETIPPIVRTEPRGPLVDDPPMPPRPPSTGEIGERIVLADAAPDLPPPVRIEAQIEPRNLQPPYPASEERAQRGGRVQVRVTIGADGRVKAVERISATNDAFWRVTERHALAHWRFQPATVDGRPVESRKLMTLTFRLEA